jgi:hypothetical protein
MVHGAINQNGGAIEIYSEPGRGTTFHREALLDGIADRANPGAAGRP